MTGPRSSWPTALRLSGDLVSRGNPLPERVAGSDMIFDLCERSAKEGFRVFLLVRHRGSPIRQRPDWSNAIPA